MSAPEEPKENFLSDEKRLLGFDEVVARGRIDDQNTAVSITLEILKRRAEVASGKINPVGFAVPLRSPDNSYTNTASSRPELVAITGAGGDDDTRSILDQMRVNWGDFWNTDESEENWLLEPLIAKGRNVPASN